MDEEALPEKRERKETTKMMEHREHEFSKEETKLMRSYERWKLSVKKLKGSLKEDLDIGTIADICDEVKLLEDKMVRTFEDLKRYGQPSIQLVRKMDACILVTIDILKLGYERISGMEGFDRQGLKLLKESDYAKSVFSSAPSESSEISEEVINVAAEYESKCRDYELLEFKLQQAERDVEKSNVKLQAYSAAMSKPVKVKPGIERTDNAENLIQGVNMDTFSKAFADAIHTSRLPVPEPTVFCGDPLLYVEWKMSFETLIIRKGIPSEEKIFYLKKYLGGTARKAVEGYFFTNTEISYTSAMNVLSERYGHPFLIQKAFRDKLDKWPKINSRDSTALREFSDFLRACKDSMLHIPSLSVLNDSCENRKLLLKLPDWVVTRWNRKVTEALYGMYASDAYPSFSEFVEFLAKEARIACNPVSSLYGLHEYELKDNKGKLGSDKAKVLTTNVSSVPDSSPAESKLRTCYYCESEGHNIYKCERFLALNINDKRSFVRSTRLCFGCLNKGHINKDCKKKHTCGMCKGRHPTCLHENRETREYRPDNNYPRASSNLQSATSFQVRRDTEQSTSMIVPVWLSHRDNPSEEILTYALLDTQSDTSFILEDTAKALNAPKQFVRLSLSTMTAEHTVIDSSRISGLQVRGIKSSVSVPINQVYTRNFIPATRSHIPERATIRNWVHLQPLMKELPPLQSCEVGLLIGYNCPQALAPRETLIGQGNEPYAVRTSLGWSVVGYTEPLSDVPTALCTSHRISVKELPACSPKDLIKVFESDFEHDRGGDKKVSQNDIQFLNLLDDNIKQRDNKHLEMPLPFKERPVLPDNKPLATFRLNSLKRKFKHNEEYYEHYKQFMNDILERGDAECVNTDAVHGNVWYIPHHGVYHPKKPGKLRVVFDCSARYRDASLNEHLLTGPDLTNRLAGVLCRFRWHPIAIMCDIEKMFHQFLVSYTDRDFLRFLWWENGDIYSEKKPIEYRMRVHLFGAASSPGCANYGLKFLAKTQEKQYPSAALFVQRDFYVDDGLTSVETEKDAIQLVSDAQILCANGGLRLHKFVSNNLNVINSIPPSERNVGVSELDLSLEQLPVERALGVQWSIKDDTFNFHVKVKDFTATRRNMLSIVASIFDPLGFITPFTLKGKQILQEMCKNGVEWDDPVPDSMKSEWEGWVSDIGNLQFLNIPRCLRPPNFNNFDIELHHFSDASNVGYGQCSYIRFVSENGIHCSLLSAKSRVAPQRVITIPRLELNAAVLSVKMSTFLREELDDEIKYEYFWTDSHVVLGYINNEARRFHTFVANRVQMIRDLSQPRQWFYINTEDNPADHASRGLTSSGLSDSNWFTGPSFLWEREINPVQINTQLQLGDPELRSVRSLHTETTNSPCLLERLERFSHWPTAVSVIARLQRLSNGIKGTQLPSVEEKRDAEMTIIRLVQHSAFKDTICCLQSSKLLPKTNVLYPLDPILQDGSLRVGGRLRKADIPSFIKHPIILPRRSHITSLILRYVHGKAKHQGRGITLNMLRAHGFWIIRGSKVVAQFIRDCVVCRKLRRPSETQRMADLPEDRVEPSPPFTYSGMDCFGPFIVKQGRKEVKRYGLLITCMCSRAIHIEMLDDMSTDAFINGLRCFIAIRGAVRQIRSDRGSNFVGAMNVFKRDINLNKLTSFLSSESQCEFLFNAPDSSHTGGVWERQIRTVRNILNSVLMMCQGRLDDSSLRTIFYEAMAIVNSRPLTVTDENNPQVQPLTPNHILTNKFMVPYPPPGEFVREDLFLRKRWRRVQFLLEQFWSRWKQEYMNDITQRQKWHEPRRNMKTGDIVLVKDLNLPRCQWPLGRVVETIIDDDNLVRRVKVKVAKGDSLSILERSVHKLVLLINVS